MRIYIDYKEVWNEFKFDCSDDNFRSLTYNEANNKLFITANTVDGLVYDLYDESLMWHDQTSDLQEAINYIK